MAYHKERYFTIGLLFISVCSFGVGNAHAADKAEILQKINADIAALEKRAGAGDKTLPTLKVNYDFHDATEDVPPNLDFYFETLHDESREKNVLRICKIHVGHEVYATDFTYYFDVDEKPLKYLATSSGVPHEMPASRDGILYGKSGEVIWNPNHVEPRLPFPKVDQIFHSLIASLEAF